MQFSILLEWTHDVSKIGTFGLVKFVFFPTQDISYGGLGDKTTNFDFFKKGLHDGHTVRIQLIFEKRNRFCWKGWRWRGRTGGVPLASHLLRAHSGITACNRSGHPDLISKTWRYDRIPIYKNQFSPLICEGRKWGEWAWNLLLVRTMGRVWGRDEQNLIDTLGL